jgi:sugar O-acyltransferase (sialic acid O-acetyltransferase NeuD family)
MRKPLIVVGSSGLGLEIYWLAEEAGWEVVGFLDDGQHHPGELVLDRPWLGPTADWVRYPEAEVVVAIGSPRTRRRVVAKMELHGQPRFATVIHPSVVASRFVTIGAGSLLGAGSIITVDVALGRHAIVNLNCTIGHNCRFGDFVTLAPMVAVSGNVTLADGVEVGTSASIRQGLTLAHGSMLGMGGVLTRSIEADSIYVGNPAKLLKSITPPWAPSSDPDPEP